MLLSILIPLYNYNSSLLIEELCGQAAALGIKWQLIAIEDGSREFVKENREACEKYGATHRALECNVGRSAIRNMLADESEGEWLLFMDCDMMVEKKDFLKTYVDRIYECGGKSVVSGGRLYWSRERYPQECTLHWTVGSNREPVAKRSEWTLLSCNFVVRRDVFMNIRFNEGIVGYGHEDTLFGLVHKRNGGTFECIDNGAVHLGLCSDEVFLKKAEESVANLVLLAKNELTREERQGVKLLRLADKLEGLHLICFVKLLSKVLMPLLRCNLLCGKPSLMMFDMYKVCVLSRQY